MQNKKRKGSFYFFLIFGIGIFSALLLASSPAFADSQIFCPDGPKCDGTAAGGCSTDLIPCTGPNPICEEHVNGVPTIDCNGGISCGGTFYTCNPGTGNPTPTTITCGGSPVSSTQGCAGSNGCNGIQTCLPGGTWSACSYSPSNGSTCSTGNACIPGTCGGGSCGGTPKVCNAPGVCQTGGTCDPGTGNCIYSPSPPTPGGYSWGPPTCGAWGACVNGSRTQTCTQTGTCNNPPATCGGSCSGPNTQTTTNTDNTCGQCTPGATQPYSVAGNTCSCNQVCQSDHTWGSCSLPPVVNASWSCPRAGGSAVCSGASCGGSAVCDPGTKPSCGSGNPPPPTPTPTPPVTCGALGVGSSQTCNSPGNACGQINSGTQTCQADGTLTACNVSPPPDSNCPPITQSSCYCSSGNACNGNLLCTTTECTDSGGQDCTTESGKGSGTSCRVSNACTNGGGGYTLNLVPPVFQANPGDTVVYSWNLTIPANTAPIVTLDLNNTCPVNSTCTFSYAAPDPDVGIVYVDGSRFFTDLGWGTYYYGFLTVATTGNTPPGNSDITVTATGDSPAGSDSKTVKLNVHAPPATVSASLIADSTDVQTGQATTLHWTVANSTSAVITSSPLDSKFNNRAVSNTAAASDSTSNLSAATTYTLTAQGNGGPVVRNVTVNTHGPPPPPPPPPPGGGGGPTACNSQNPALCSVGGGGPAPTCSQIKITWQDNSGGIASFKIYQDNNNNAIGTAPAGQTFFVFNTGSDNGPHTYYVSEVTASGESTKALANNSPISSSACVGSMGSSDKDMLQINGANINYSGGGPNPCNGYTDVLPSNIVPNVGDVLTFGINLCNNGSSDASNFVITDVLTNLAKVNASGNLFNASFTNASGSVSTLNFTANSATCNNSSGYYCQLSSSDPNQVILKFNLSNAVIPKPNSAAGETVRWGTIKVSAKLITPSGYSGNSPRYQNSFSTLYDKAPGVPGNFNGGTPLQFYRLHQDSPTIKEIP